MKYILAIDQSTQGTKAIITDEQGKIIRKSSRIHKQIVNEKGYISHDAEEIYSSVLSAVKEAVSGLENNIAAAGITNQRETSLYWDKSGKPTDLAVVWQCGRAKDICGSLKPYSALIKEKTGIPISPYFPAAKLSWLLKNGEAGKKSDVMPGTIDSYLIYRLTGNYKTDFSNASRTQLFNINALEWDKELCEIFGIDSQNLPEVCDGDALFGYTDFEGILPEKIPVHAVLGDSHAAFFAQGCTQLGDIKATYGTGSSVMMNTGERVFNSSTLAASIGFKLGGKLNYVLEGNIASTGAAISWLKDNVGLISSPEETEKLCISAEKSDGLYFIPAFSGLSAPYWNTSARGMLCGISRTTGKKEIVRAVVESIAYSINDVIEEMEKSSCVEVHCLRADGGAAGNKYLMQFQSDISSCQVRVSENAEMSALGAAFAAGIKIGMYPENIYSGESGSTYLPVMENDRRKELLKGWKQSVDMIFVNNKNNSR